MNDTASRVRRNLFFVFIAGLALTYLFPFYIMIVQSLKTPRDSIVSPMSFPKSLYLQNFSDAWVNAGLGRALVTSSIIAAVSVTLLALFGAAAAYVLARRSGRLPKVVYLCTLLALAIPFQLGIIPLYSLARQAHLLGSELGLILYYVGLQMPFTVFIYTAFLMASPTDFEDAAEIDGASHLQVLRYIVLPELSPATATVVLLNLVYIWNDLFVPLLFLSGSSKSTLPVSIFTFVGQYSAQWNLVFAGLFMAMIPVVICFVLFQRRVIEGFSAGMKA
jgi:raffinose/stachyose/melibiose transport system permease protein